MSWVIVYCVLVFGGLAGCLIHDQLIARHHPERRHLEVDDRNSVHYK